MNITHDYLARAHVSARSVTPRRPAAGTSWPTRSAPAARAEHSPRRPVWPWPGRSERTDDLKKEPTPMDKTTHLNGRNDMTLMHEDLARAQMAARLGEAQQLRRGARWPAPADSAARRRRPHGTLVWPSPEPVTTPH